MKVLIADDEAIVLEGLKYIIDWEALGFSICSQARTGDEALEKLTKLSPDLVLLDIRMPGLTVKKQIEEERRSARTMNQYRENARDTIIRSLLTKTGNDISSMNLADLHLSTDIYQVVIYERFNNDPFQVTWDFAELLRVSNQDHNSFDHVNLDHKEVILLKGSFALQRFERLLEHYHVNPQKGSPLDSLFLTYGRKVYRAGRHRILLSGSLCPSGAPFFL